MEQSVSTIQILSPLARQAGIIHISQNRLVDGANDLLSNGVVLIGEQFQQVKHSDVAMCNCVPPLEVPVFVTHDGDERMRALRDVKADDNTPDWHSTI